MININNIYWFYYNSTAYPYIFNNDETKIKLLLHHSQVIPLQDDCYYKLDAAKKAIKKLCDGPVEFYDSSDIFARFLNFPQWLIVSKGNEPGKVDINLTQLKLMKQFFENQMKKHLKKQAKVQKRQAKKKEQEFFERDF